MELVGVRPINHHRAFALRRVEVPRLRQIENEFQESSRSPGCDSKALKGRGQDDKSITGRAQTHPPCEVSSGQRGRGGQARDGKASDEERIGRGEGTSPLKVKEPGP
jgi:hypothetical protein